MQELGIKHVHSKRISAKYYSAGTLYKDSIIITFFCLYSIPGNHKIEPFIQSQNLTKIFLNPHLKKKTYKLKCKINNLYLLYSLLLLLCVAPINKNISLN